MSKRIMIVDDAIFMRMKLKDILEKNGYEVVAEAQNGADAIEKYKSERPEIVTMDITMPEMDGIQALKGIKKIDPQARVVMCSAMGQQAMVMEAIQSGAVDFIVKPFETDRVLDALVKAGR
ncbi:response regulator [Proteiniclasticum sp. BAD-10]|uniref:Stage 0 sporulation protein A homolog n=1 Tax=Proteiniclasticum sediminis TaxID=2804028 RepID=A0A941HR90_9CLOT|nr:response regulator [Proteiniclasticum sediminis]MBR0575982.1 response regulator [Proteiniclasticum sediminis]